MKGLVTVDAERRGGYDRLRPGGGLIRPNQRQYGGYDEGRRQYGGGGGRGYGSG